MYVAVVEVEDIQICETVKNSSRFLSREAVWRHVGTVFRYTVNCCCWRSKKVGDTNSLLRQQETGDDSRSRMPMEDFSHPDYQRGSLQNVIPVSAPVVISVTQSLMKDLPSHFRQDWHSSSHSRTRDTMKQCILHLIHQRKAYPPPEWLHALPDVCGRVEEHLYHMASDFEEYNNPHSLLDRSDIMSQLSLLYNTVY